jgi:leucyl-tRNA synthetase
MNAFESLSYSKWPVFNSELAKENLITIAIQVNGKLRGDLQLPAETDDKTLKTEAAKVDGVKKHLKGKDIVKKVIVPGRLVNFVVK